jgi:hypothetical protein
MTDYLQIAMYLIPAGLFCFGVVMLLKDIIIWRNIPEANR